MGFREWAVQMGSIPQGTAWWVAGVVGRGRHRGGQALVPQEGRVLGRVSANIMQGSEVYVYSL